MKKPSSPLLPGIKRSLSGRLSLWIVLFAIAIFIATLSYVYAVLQKAVRREAINGATRELENTVLRVNVILEDVELLADNLETLIYKDLDNPDAMMELSRSIVVNNPFLNGCSISFEPYFYPSKGKYYSCYSNNNGHRVYTQQEGNDQYQYFYLDWYLLPKLLNQPCWTEPYTDQEESDDETMDSKMSVSYCKPLIGNDGSFVGTLSLDISLEWLSETISAVKSYPHSYSVVVGRGGTYLVHPDAQKLFYQTIFTNQLEHPDKELWTLGKAMLDWEDGMREIMLEGQTNYVFYKPLMTTGWSVGIVCPEKDIFGAFHRQQRIVVAIVILGLLLMFMVFSRVINRQLEPLRKLAVQARTIANGNFAQKLPDTNRTDEIGVLSKSFNYMQGSLVNYIDELTSATAKRERLEGELHIARSIQMTLVPNKFPAFPDRKDIDLYAFMAPAKEVGGDLYEYFIQDGKLHFCIGDVSGKGVPASLFMAITLSLFHMSSRQGLPPAEVARQINDGIAEKNEQLMFVTLFIGQLDLKTGRLEFCNCGHNPPVLMRPAPEFMQCLPNTPIGVCPGWDFEGQVLEIGHAPILLYTDGLNEAENIRHEELGNDRVLAVLNQEAYTDAKALVERLRIAVASHVGTAEPSDDLTLLCLSLLG